MSEADIIVIAMFIGRESAWIKGVCGFSPRPHCTNNIKKAYQLAPLPDVSVGLIRTNTGMMTSPIALW